MARGHGRILTSIWEDEDFLALTQERQRLYLFLISQPNLNHAGLLPLTLKRWSRKSIDLTAADLDKHLTALDHARFIVVDDDTEELLIRSFIRNDGVWKQPKVMGAAVSGALEISSRRLRRALLDEMDRIPLEDLSDEPGSRAMSIRQEVAQHIETLRAAFWEPNPEPPAEQHPKGDAKGGPQGRAEGPADGGAGGSTRARAQVPRAHSPAPAPIPCPHPVEDGAVADVIELPLGDTPAADTAKPRGTTNKPSKHQTADELAAAFWERYKTSTAQTFIAIRGVIRPAISNGNDRDDVARALAILGDEGRAISGGTLQTALQQVRGRRSLARASGGYQPHRDLPESDYHNDQGF